jgi:hypothetical protein
MRRLILLALLAAPLAASAQPSSTVLVERRAASNPPAAVFEAQVTFNTGDGLGRVSELLALVEDEPFLREAEISGRATTSVIEVIFAFPTHEDLTTWLAREETNGVIARLRAINPNAFRYELDLVRR